jgi:transcriptional regulator with XRE-family HTH domain
MTPAGRFGQLFNAAVERKHWSLYQLAEKLDYSYEQFRKILTGKSSPSPLLLKEFCRLLDMDMLTAETAVAADRMERKYGKSGLAALGQDPRLAQLNTVAGMLTDAEIATLVTVAQGLVRGRSA